MVCYGSQRELIQPPVSFVKTALISLGVWCCAVSGCFESSSQVQLQSCSGVLRVVRGCHWRGQGKCERLGPPERPVQPLDCFPFCGPHLWQTGALHKEKFVMVCVYCISKWWWSLSVLWVFTYANAVLAELLTRLLWLCHWFPDNEPPAGKLRKETTPTIVYLTVERPVQHSP